MSDALPKGWANPALGEVVEITSGNSKLTKKKYTSEGKFVAFSGSGPDGLVDFFEYEGHAIILSAVGARCGKCFKADGKWVAIANTSIIRVLDDDPFLYEYLFYLLNNEDFWPKGGSAQPFVQTGKAKAETIIPLPPLAEQKRIVAKLEKVLEKVDASRARLDKIPRLLKRFRQSVLAAACSGKLTADWREENACPEDATALLDRMKEERRKRCLAENGKRKYREADSVVNEDLPNIPVTWCWTNFDHCSWEITVGHVGPMRDRYVEEGVTFLRCQNVKPLRFSEKGLVSIPADFHAQLSKSELLGGEILVVRSGANTGDCCVFPRNNGAANCSDLVITRPLSGLCSEYGALCVNSPMGQELLSLSQTGIAQPHFNIGAMRIKAFPLPPFLEQQEIVRRVEELFALADQLEARYAKAKAQIDRLTQSILAKAFRGELVPQDPTDEPASVLLARLRSATPASKVRKKRAQSKE